MVKVSYIAPSIRALSNPKMSEMTPKHVFDNFAKILGGHYSGFQLGAVY